MTTMKTLMLGLSAAALTIGGVAVAQTPAAEKPRMERMRKDANGDGVTTRAEAQAAATQMFAKLDANKDGKLDKADRQLARQQMREHKFAKLDANSDGSISKAEFTAERGPRAEKAEGQRGPGKFKRGHRGHHGFGGARGGMMMMKAADTNNDGALSQAEFVAAALKRFDAQDANKDGKVTAEERQAARAAHMEQRKARWEARKADKSAAN